MNKKEGNAVWGRIKMEKTGGFGGWFIFLLILAILMFIFGIPFVVCGFMFMSGEGMAMLAYVGCGLVAVAAVLMVAVFVRRKIQIKKYNNEYKKWKSKSREDRWEWMHSRKEEPKTPKNSALDRAFAEAVRRAAWGHSSSSRYSSSSSSSSSNSMRVKLKDGSELHTEERFGDYKTYLYNKDGKNTGLHVNGNKVLDDNYNEVGHFDSSGKFNPKN